MPNWCENELTVEGPKDEFKAFIEFIGNGKEIAEKFIPYPQKFKKQDKLARIYQKMLDNLDRDSRQLTIALHDAPRDGYNSGGYGWCCRSWGTKLDFNFNITASDSEYMEVEFMTAWSPPRPVILAMSEKFPNLLFTLDFKEEGMDFQGTYKAKGGKELYDFEEKLDSIPAEEKDGKDNEH